MIVRELGRESCLQALATAPVARLACASNGQPYVVPVFLAYHKSFDGDDCLYGFTTHGQKVDWMRANPLVCVEVDRVTNRSEWVSVIAYGRYEELPNVHERTAGRSPSRQHPNDEATPRRFSLESVNEQLFAHRLLEDRAMWWEPASSVRNLAEENTPNGHFAPVFYKIRLNEVTGYEAFSEPDTTPNWRSSPQSEAAPRGWIGRALQRVAGCFGSRHVLR